MQRYKIFVVEDEKDVLSMYTDLLVSSGFEVIDATDGIEAVRKAKEHHWDLLLLDIMLPHVDGLAILTEVKSKFPERPVLMISNLVNDSAISRALEGGASGYVIKSELNPDQFLLEVKKHLGIL